MGGHGLDQDHADRRGRLPARESFGDRFELPPDRAYNETCASIASIQWSWRLLLATGESKYADHIERLIYNGLGGAISAGGQRFFYVNPLQRREGHYERDDPGRRREWFSCACCPPNIMRLLASVGHYLATASADDVLCLHQFTGANIGANLAGGTLRVEMTTGYPWSGTVDVRVRQAARSHPIPRTAATSSSGGTGCQATSCAATSPSRRG